MRVGIFDSGIGGINVLANLLYTYPNNEYVFYGDTLNLPYGSKSVDELKEFASNIIDFLIEKKVDLIVIACGTISSNCYDYLKSKYDIPIYDIISPTINYVENSSYSNVGVIATERTIESKIFEKSDKVALAHATKDFVNIIEDGNISNKKDEIENELSLFKGKVDSLILGCTHYPSLSNIINDYLNVPLIDMGRCLMEELPLSNDGKSSVDLYFSLINKRLVKNIRAILKKDYPVRKLIVNRIEE